MWGTAKGGGTTTRPPSPLESLRAVVPGLSVTLPLDRLREKRVCLRGPGCLVGRCARRRAAEDFLERPVYLELSVQVAPGWRQQVESLREYGYFDPLLM